MLVLVPSPVGSPYRPLNGDLPAIGEASSWNRKMSTGVWLSRSSNRASATKSHLACLKVNLPDPRLVYTRPFRELRGSPNGSAPSVVREGLINGWFWVPRPIEPTSTSLASLDNLKLPVAVNWLNWLSGSSARADVRPITAGSDQIMWSVLLWKKDP